MGGAQKIVSKLLSKTFDERPFSFTPVKVEKIRNCIGEGENFLCYSLVESKT